MTSKGWKEQLERQRDMKKRGIKLLFQRVRLLAEVYESQEFRDWCLKEGLRDTEFLDSELSDVGLNFLTLRAVLEQFPKESHWINADLRKLVASVIEDQKKERKLSGGRETQSWKKRCLEAEAECERLRAELDAVKEQLREYKEILAARPTEQYRPVGV